MKLKLSSLGAAVALLCVAPAAFADATANISITNLQFTLVDLDTNDGIAASITFAGGSNPYFYTLSGNYPWADWVSNQVYGSEPFSPLAGASNSALGGAEGTLSGSPFAGSATGSANANAQGSGAGFSQSAALYRDMNNSFTLSANTQLRITGVVSASGRVNDASGDETAAAGYSMDLYGMDASGNQVADTRGLFWNACGGNPTYCNYPTSFAESDTFNLSFSNLLTSSTTGQIRFSFDATSSTTALTSIPITPVPEPESYAMFLAGLAAIGFVRRRSNQGKSASPVH
jgi:hypothetical protein